jgi:hypothetical protein
MAALASFLPEPAIRQPAHFQSINLEAQQGQTAI